MTKVLPDWVPDPIEKTTDAEIDRVVEQLLRNSDGHEGRP